MDFSSIACWIWPVISGIVCALFGYGLGRFKNKKEAEENNIDLWKRKNAQLQVDLENCRSQLLIISAAAGKSGGLNDSDITPIKAVAFDAKAAKKAFGKTITENDLKIIDGIGPKIAELFNEHQITTWEDLANTTVEQCEIILASGGNRFEFHSPTFWPEQAKMAALGEWESLKKWQDEHQRSSK